MKGLSADHGKGSGSALKGEAFFEGGRWPSVRERDCAPYSRQASASAEQVEDSV